MTHDNPACLHQTWFASLSLTHIRLSVFYQKLISEHKAMQEAQAANQFEEGYLEPLENLLALIEDILIDDAPKVPQDLNSKTEFLIHCFERGEGSRDLIKRYTFSLMEALAPKEEG